MSLTVALWQGIAPRSDKEASDVFQNIAKHFLPTYGGRKTPPEPVIKTVVDKLVAKWPEYTSGYYNGANHPTWNTEPLSEDISGPLFFTSLSSDSAEMIIIELNKLAKKYKLVVFDVDHESLVYSPQLEGSGNPDSVLVSKFKLLKGHFKS